VLGRIFGLKRDGITEGWRKMHNEKIRTLHSSPNTIGMIKSRKIIWTEHVVNVGEKCIQHFRKTA
jgi:uncharacterized protein YlzI (FlbEa/FlbD family)